ncbi:MAG: alpha/beta hydrolase [Proteobacteria bacterium]|nr:alpha/beta hydrolase [Pseudomonadota bacterium]
MKSHTVTGGGGVQLHVVETGNPQGRPILFIHGLSQCGLCWKKQLESDLADDFRLIAMDVRGHGLSEKPKGAYGDSQPWADDVQAVITGLGLNQPVLSGWSYGGEIICDYLRHYGEEHIGGLNLIGAVSKLGEPVFPYLSQEFMGIAEGLFSDVVEDSVATLNKFIHIWFDKKPTMEDYYLFLGFNANTPPYVRAEAFGRLTENDDILTKISKPVLITHGENDRLVLIAMAEYHKTKIAHARLSRYPDSGHIPFWEYPERFNSELRSFTAAL